MCKHCHRFQRAGKKKAQSGLMDHLPKKYFFKTIWYMKLKFPGNHYIFKRYTIKVLCILEGRRLVLIWDLMAQCLHCAAWTQPHRFFKGPFDKEAEWWSVASDHLPHHLKSKWCGLWWVEAQSEGKAANKCSAYMGTPLRLLEELQVMTSWSWLMNGEFTKQLWNQRLKYLKFCA